MRRRFATRAGRCASPAPARRRSGATPIDASPSLSTRELDRIVEHNVGDLTAVVEAGVTLGRLREKFAEDGQMLALDPPGDDATIGGIVATGDSGPLRHRYGGPRDLVLGVTRRAVRRHGRARGRQGDQERRGLRPVEADDRRLRDARGDRPGGRAPAPAAARHGDRLRRGRRPGGARADRARGVARAVRADRARLRLARVAGLVSTCASAASTPRPRPRGGDGARARPAARPTWSHDDDVPVARPGGAAALRGRARSCACRTPDAARRAARAWPSVEGATAVGRVALGRVVGDAARLEPGRRGRRRARHAPHAGARGVRRARRARPRCASGSTRGASRTGPS